METKMLFPVIQPKKLNRSKEIAELRMAKKVKHLFNLGERRKEQINKDKEAFINSCNHSLSIFAKRQAQKFPKLGLSRIKHRRSLCDLYTQETGNPLESDQLPDIITTPTVRKARMRSNTISLPIESISASMKEPYVQSVKKDKHGLMMPALQGDDVNIILDGSIPKSVLQRGRRMSRSADCMEELIRQEISDYVDKKHHDLPFIDIMATKPLIKTRSESALSVSMRKKTESLKAKVHLSLEVPHSLSITRGRFGPATSLSDVDISQTNGREISDEKGSSPIPQPSPPLKPKPPSMVGGACRRHKYLNS